jgi:hypothetical protein
MVVVKVVVADVDVYDCGRSVSGSAFVFLRYHYRSVQLQVSSVHEMWYNLDRYSSSPHKVLKFTASPLQRLLSPPTYPSAFFERHHLSKNLSPESRE